jgi:hypothetical protein
MAMTPFCTSIEDYLGPGDNRFFGMGYRRVQYHVSNIVATPANVPDAGARATITVQYPRDWSKKKDADLRPHLSSVDTLILCTQLCELHLAHAYGLDHNQRRSMWLRRVKLRAGTIPQEELEGMTATAKLCHTNAIPDAENTFLSVFDCQIGVMQARCEIVHEITAPATEQRYFETVQDILDPSEHRYYGEGFKLKGQRIHNVQFDAEQLQAQAAIDIVPDAVPQTVFDGIEGKYQPAISMVDCFVINLQMAQVLMYELDHLKRSESSTLWMLQTIMEASSPARPHSGLDVQTKVTGKHLLKLRGLNWRNVDIAGSCGGIQLRCSLAHALPVEKELANAA